jgi:uncharacterized membrane protein
MRPSSLHFFPLARPFLAALLLVVALVFGLMEIGVLEYAYVKVGVSRHCVFSLLMLSLLGSYVNIPVAELPAERMRSGESVSFFGVRYMIPTVHEWPRTVVAVNLGGAVIPVLLSLYLAVTNGVYLDGAIGVLIVTVIVHRLAQPVRGVGIAVPTFIPPVVAASVALLLSRTCAPCVAYIAGSLGTLIGGDLLNLGKIKGLGAPVASVGGAGTFDGIFLTGILAVLLA